MKDRLFIDNDVILDISIERASSVNTAVNAAIRLFNFIEKGCCDGYTSSVVFTNTYYIQRKLKNHETAISFLKKLRLVLTVLNVDDLILQKALESGWPDFEDSVQYFTAIENKIDCIITRNTSDYKKSVIPVYTPIEFLEMKKIMPRR